MASRKKKPVAVPEPAKPKPKKYWVEVLDDDYQVIDSITVPWNAPVMVGGSELKLISDCEDWEDLQLFYTGKWSNIGILPPQKRYTVRLEYTVTCESPDSEEEVLARYRSYGNSAKATLVGVEDLSLTDD
jgi:hypothetical protein